MKTRILMTAVLGVVMAIGTAQAQLQNNREIIVAIDDEPVMFQGITPREVDGRVLVPLRGVLEDIGAYVEYDPLTRTVIASRADMELELGIGSRMASVNGQPVALDVPAMSIAGTTMVPLRFMSEALGARVRWNPQTAVVSIDTGTRVARTFEPRNRAFRRPRAVIPSVTSVNHNIRDGWIDPGDVVRVTMRATPGGTGWFRVRGMVGQLKMQETAPGPYEGVWRADVPASMELVERDVLAFVVVGDRATAETHPIP
jgi:hypothetical protein